MGTSSRCRQGAADDAADFSDDLEVQIYEDILAREKTGDSFPDRNVVEAMEVPLHRLTGAAVLFSDITTESIAAPELRMRGLCFLAEAMFREALRLLRLYHGHPPGYLWQASRPYPCRCGYGLISGERDAAPVSPCFVDIQMRNRADKKIMLVNGRYQQERNMMLDQRTKRPTDGLAITVSSF